MGAARPAARGNAVFEGNGDDVAAKVPEFDAAATRPVDKLMLVTPYDSIANVAADRYPWAPIRWLLKGLV
jgi:hypothetical protein